MEGVSLTTFAACCEMIAGHLRIKEADRWSVGGTMDLKYQSFRAQYPEVTDIQFLWASEQWIQSCPNSDRFMRYPTWGELMAFLYRCEGGQANRTWGFREDLPEFAAPSQWQIEQAARGRRSLLPPPDSLNTDAYRTVGRAAQRERLGLPPVAEPDLPALPPASDALDPGPAWQDLIRASEEYDPDRPDETAADP